MKPDLLVLKDAPDQAADQGALFSRIHLRALYPPDRRINLPARYAHVRRPGCWKGWSIWRRCWGAGCRACAGGHCPF